MKPLEMQGFSLSGMRVIRSLWITRKSIDGGFHPPEMLEAWDEWSIYDNPEGWTDACEEALRSVGNDLSSHRYIDLRVPEQPLNAAFDPVEIVGTPRASA